jgi:hypothetical protein
VEWRCRGRRARHSAARPAVVDARARTQARGSKSRCRSSRCGGCQVRRLPVAPPHATVLVVPPCVCVPASCGAGWPEKGPGRPGLCTAQKWKGVARRDVLLHGSPRPGRGECMCIRSRRPSARRRPWIAIARWRLCVRVFGQFCSHGNDTVHQITDTGPTKLEMFVSFQT